MRAVELEPDRHDVGLPVSGDGGDAGQPLGVERAALTGLVDRAERRGLVERRAVPGDRRAVSVALTPAGRKTATEFHAEAMAELNQILAPLTPGERASFRTALDTITRTAGPADRCGPHAAC